MIDIKLDPLTWDLATVDSDLVVARDEDETVQHIRQRLLTFLDEWFLDRSVGVPWLQKILEKQVETTTVETLLQHCIRTSPGVTALTSFGLSEGTGERAIRCDFTVTIGATATPISLEI